MLCHANSPRAPSSCQEEHQQDQQDHQALHPFILNDLVSPMMTRSTNSYQPRASVLWMDQQLRKRRERLATQLSQQSCIDSRTTPEWTTSVPYLPEGLDQGMKSYVLSPRNQRLWQSSSLHNLSRSARGTHPSVGLSSQNQHSHQVRASGAMTPNSSVPYNEQPALHSSHRENSESQPSSAMEYLNIEAYMCNRNNDEQGPTPFKLRPREKVRHMQTLEADARYFLTSVS